MLASFRGRAAPHHSPQGNGRTMCAPTGLGNEKHLRQHRTIPALRLKHRSGICRTSLAVSALRIMRYCPKYRRPARASPGLWCADGLFVCRRTAGNGIFCKFFARQRGQLLPRGGFYTIIKISCLYQLPVQNTEKKARRRPAIEGWNVRR